LPKSINYRWQNASLQILQLFGIQYIHGGTN
jgi:hypothetical protein